MGSAPLRLWMRSELRVTEHRAPLVPQDAGRLVSHAVELTVEEAPHRSFPIADYANAGCRVARSGAWVRAHRDQVILGLKELPPTPAALVHQHVFFAHAYKGQKGAHELLRRFVTGGGALLDLEYLVDDQDRRLVAFGYWAGYAGAALAVLHWHGRLIAPLRPIGLANLDAELAACAHRARPRVLVVGALGRCGRGARDALATAGITPSCWDVDETRALDRRALLDHDILVNTVLATRSGPPFLVPDHLDDPRRRLSLISDVSCDAGSACNVLPIYDRATDWDQPVRRIRGGERRLDLIAIDNLPSLVPAEASAAFSAELAPLLLSLGAGAPPWPRCRGWFHEACRAADFLGPAGPRRAEADKELTDA
jgi:saccharopine dehydrogenase (NAD+, L-lysine forming)